MNIIANLFITKTVNVNQDKTISFVGSVSDVKTVLSGYVSGNICDDYEMIFAAEDGFKTALKCTSNGETTEFMIDPETNISNDLTGLTLELKKKYIYNIRFNNTASISYDNDEHKYSLKESSASSYLYVSKSNELSFVSCNENDEYCDFTLNSNYIISLTSDSSGLSDGYEWVLTANDGATWKFKQNETRHIDVSDTLTIILLALPMNSAKCRATTPDNRISHPQCSIIVLILRTIILVVKIIMVIMLS